jgi:hypothetical protein
MVRSKAPVRKGFHVLKQILPAFALDGSQFGDY